jgi:mannose-6-phosphate isomerase-like protein (cupin superfamily)
MFKRRVDTPVTYKPNCHGGDGIMVCYEMLQASDSGFGLKHFQLDTLFPGVTIGEHLHDCDEEIYCCIEGEGTLLYDGEKYPFAEGDLSLVTVGHTHGMANTGTKEMKVVIIKVGERDR